MKKKIKWYQYDDNKLWATVYVPAECFCIPDFPNVVPVDRTCADSAEEERCCHENAVNFVSSRVFEPDWH